MLSAAFLEASDAYQAALARLGGFMAQLDAAHRDAERLAQLPDFDLLDYLLYLGLEAVTAQERVDHCLQVVRDTPPRARPV